MSRRKPANFKSFQKSTKYVGTKSTTGSDSQPLATGALPLAGAIRQKIAMPSGQKHPAESIDVTVAVILGATVKLHEKVLINQSTGNL